MRTNAIDVRVCERVLLLFAIRMMLMSVRVNDFAVTLSLKSPNRTRYKCEKRKSRMENERKERTKNNTGTHE